VKDRVAAELAWRRSRAMREVLRDGSDCVDEPIEQSLAA
jgi:hypothetical protein